MNWVTQLRKFAGGMSKMFPHFSCCLQRNVSRERKAKGKTNKTEPRTDEFKHSQLLQTTNNTKIKKWLLGKDQVQDSFRKT